MSVSLYVCISREAASRSLLALAMAYLSSHLLKSFLSYIVIHSSLALVTHAGISQYMGIGVCDQLRLYCVRVCGGMCVQIVK